MDLVRGISFEIAAAESEPDEIDIGRFLNHFADGDVRRSSRNEPP
jgi:hypothetical protein